MRARRQKALAWCGPLLIVLWLGSFVLLAGFIPPPHANDSAQQILDRYAHNTFGIRLGLMITLFASALIVPFAAVISAQIRRIEGDGAPLALTQVCSAAVLSLEFIVPIMVWQTAAFRFDAEGARIVLMLDDMGWLMFVAVISSVIVQVLAIGWAILTDERDQPVFPRWAGWFNLWIALLLAPAGIVVFFKSGPFSWAGLMSFFVPLTSYAAWSIVMFILVRRAIDQEAAELTPALVAADRSVPVAS
jgi:hypothetical protein